MALISVSSVLNWIYSMRNECNDAWERWLHHKSFVLVHSWYWKWPKWWYQRPMKTLNHSTLLTLCSCGLLSYQQSFSQLSTMWKCYRGKWIERKPFVTLHFKNIDVIYCQYLPVLNPYTMSNVRTICFPSLCTTILLLYSAPNESNGVLAVVFYWQKGSSVFRISYPLMEGSVLYFIGCKWNLFSLVA